ncbi:MFS transporter [Sphingomonas sp. NSE70-1]|uniref:MFS transporter n=1 Tax=Sphingomonas caseinilyticus TaxID=2908205 RepID=A0ABT0RWY0_9SPHN|nr:MFS transporter [Sphingomonas caseinilyticus]MCL6699512.1 MFS transporter [Sphingomonas caseinilyticus]
MNVLLRSFATGAEAPRIEQQSEIDRLFRRNRIRVMLAITIGYGLIYMCRLAIGVVKKPLIDQGIFTPTELGTIGSALFYTYALGKLTNGFLADHANARRFLTAAFLLTAICNLFMGFTTTVLAATIIWGLNGWFQSFGAPGGVVAMTAWFSNKERGRAYGVWSTAHSIGEGLTFLVVGGLVSYLGWQWGYWGPGLIGIVTAIGVFALMQDRPQTLGLPSVNEWKKDQYTETSESSARSTLALQFSILKIPAIWVLALASATTYITRYGINSWGILYLQEARGYSLPMAGTLLMISTLAGIAGAVAFGFTSDKLFNARRPPANLLFAILELLGLAIIFFGPTNTPMLIVGMLLFGMGLTGLVTSLGGLFGVDIAPKRAAGAAMGVVGIFSYIGAAIQEQVSGILIDQNMAIAGDDRIYDFGPVIWFWIGSSVVSMLLAASLWRTRLRD